MLKTAYCRVVDNKASMMLMEVGRQGEGATGKMKRICLTSSDASAPLATAKSLPTPARAVPEVLAPLFNFRGLYKLWSAHRLIMKAKVK